jgi:soluble lytic murein transglycosylase
LFQFGYAKGLWVMHKTANFLFGLFIGTFLAFSTATTHSAVANSNNRTQSKLADQGGDPFLRGLDAIDSGRWEWAKAAERQLNDQKMIRYLKWKRLVSNGYAADFDEVSDFIAKHPDWPQQKSLELKAEQSLYLVGDDRLVANWFSRHPPQTPNGTTLYIKSLYSLGKQDDAVQVARNAWYTHNWPQQGENEFLERYGQLLDSSDHQARVERLLGENNPTAARRILKRVPANYSPIAEARLKMIDGLKDIDGALLRLSSDQQANNGLLYERTRWLRKNDRDADAQRILLTTPPTDFPDKWWGEREIQARRAMLAGDNVRAYELASKHGLKPSDNNWTDAEQLAGWLALVKLNQPSRAWDHFQTLLGNSYHPNTRSKAAYWAARAAETANDFGRANTLWQEAAKYPTTFYGQLAFKSLRRAGVVAANASPWFSDPKLAGEAKTTFMKDPMVETANLLARYGHANDIEPFLLRIADTTEEPGAFTAVAEMAMKAKRPATAVKIARHAMRDQVTLIDSGYPLLQVPSNGLVEPSLVLAIIRQESGFQVDALSSAGARGLMQLMPQTAQDTAKAMRQRFTLNRLTTDPAYNMMVGTFYARSVLTKFNNSYLMTFAAYNAGPNRAQGWAEKYGDPRQPGVDPLIWIESIPFRETRGYVQRVSEGIEVYRHRLRSTGQKIPDEQLKASGWCPVSCW